MLVQRVLRWLRVMVGDKPSLYFPLSRLSPANERFRVTRDTSLVIEGYPRSGNSFAVRAFMMSQPRKPKLRLAHHLHVPAQVLRAAEWRIPTIVLIRRPMDAAISVLQRVDWLSGEDALAQWIWFYRAIQPARAWFVIATFDEVTTRFGDVIERVNTRYGTAFVPFAHTSDNVERVFAGIDARAQSAGRGMHQVSRPTDERKARRAEIARRLESPGCRELIATADDLYTGLAEGA